MTSKKDCDTCVSRQEVELFALNLIEIVEVYLEEEVKVELGRYLQAYAEDLGMTNLIEKVEEMIEVEDIE